MNHDAHYLDSFSAHHRDGIAMARLAEQKAQDPELKKLAAKMVKEQTQEMDQMKKWRDQYFPNVQSMEEKPEQVDLSKLEEAKGKEFDSQFAKMMIQHHEDGIKLTKDVSSTLKNEKIKNFADQSVSKQNEEIKRLNEISKKLDRRS
jgi:predicted outer membrane protein